MCSRSITRGEDFAGNNECSCIGSKVFEKVAETVEGKQPAGADDVVAETDDTEKDCKNDEPPNLYWFATNSVDGGDGHPVSGNETGDGEDEIPSAGIVQPR